MILHRLHDFLDAIGADDLGHRFDCEGLTWLGKDHGAQEADHLARHGISTHTHTLPGASLSMKYGQQSTEEYAHGIR